MSRSHNHNGTFVDTGLLRDHVSKLREERKTAEKLRESIMAMRQSSDPTAFSEYSPVLRDINQLIEYFERMARVLAEAEAEAIKISRETSRNIEDDTVQIRRKSSSAFML